MRVQADHYSQLPWLFTDSITSSSTQKYNSTAIPIIKKSLTAIPHATPSYYGCWNLDSTPKWKFNPHIPNDEMVMKTFTHSLDSLNHSSTPFLRVTNHPLQHQPSTPGEQQQQATAAWGNCRSGRTRGQRKRGKWVRHRNLETWESYITRRMIVA